MLVRPRFEEPEAPTEFGVLHDDGSVLAIDKPSGLPMHPSATYHCNTLTFLLRERYGEPAPHIAHRLDRETSGVVVCGRHLDAERALKRAFERRLVRKSYLAIVAGELPDEGEVRLPMGPAREGLHVCMEVREDGAPACTRFRVLERTCGHALVHLSPETGRQHQLRVHLAAIGAPIVGDKLYGVEGVRPFLEYIDTGMTDHLASRLGHARQALHAYEVEVPHPVTHAPLALVAPLAPDLHDLWKTLRGERVTSVTGACPSPSRDAGAPPFVRNGAVG